MLGFWCFIHTCGSPSALFVCCACVTACKVIEPACAGSFSASVTFTVDMDLLGGQMLTVMRSFFVWMVVADNLQRILHKCFGSCLRQATYVKTDREDITRWMSLSLFYGGLSYCIG